MFFLRCYHTEKRKYSCPVRIDMWKMAMEYFLFLSTENVLFRSCPRKTFYKWKTA